MSAIATAVPLSPSARSEQVFPTLTPEQIARAAAHGRARSVKAGEVLVEAGHQYDVFFVVTAGRLQVVRPSGAGGEIVAEHRPGQFSGETNLLSGRRALANILAVEPTEVIALDRAALLSLVQTDSELSEIFMRAFILRRLELFAHGFGDVVLLGSD
jgi:thioredoxin reductase (NADPH)